MTLVADFNTSVSVPFSRFRQVLEDSGRLVEGVAGSTHLVVSQRAAGANMSVDIAVGQAWVEVDTGTRNGYGHVTSDAIENRTITASNATNPRVDQVVLQWNETAIPTGSGDVPTLTVLAGTPTAGAQANNSAGANYRAGAATLGNDRLLLADLLIPATSTSVTTANIFDRRQSAVAPGAFSAYRASASSLTTGSVVPFDTEEWDASNWFDIVGANRFTPQVAGFYRLSWAVTSSSFIAANAVWRADLRKNGATHRIGQPVFQIGTAAAVTSTGSADVQANGTTDNFDVLLTHGNGSTVPLSVNALTTFFQGEMIGRI